MPTEMCRHSYQDRENCWSQDGCDYANNKYDGYPCKNSCKDACCIVSNRALRFLILSMEQACLIARKRQIRAQGTPPWASHDQQKRQSKAPTKTVS